MSQTVDVYTICVCCGGDGLQPTGAVGGGIGPSIPCTWPGCNGTGKYKIGYVELDPGLDGIEDKLNDVLNKCNDIKEKLDEM